MVKLIFNGKRLRRHNICTCSKKSMFIITRIVVMKSIQMIYIAILYYNDFEQMNYTIANYIVLGSIKILTGIAKTSLLMM